MIEAIRISNTGLTASESFLEVTGNNLANLNTTGFKRAQITFADLFYQTLQAPGAPSGPGTTTPVGVQIGLGTAVAATTGIFTQGPLEQTNVPLDVAINGDGFFQVGLADGRTAYTRSGAFTIDSSGRLATEQGFLLNPPITIPAGTTSVLIGTDGSVSVTTVDSPTTAQPVGQLTLTQFSNPSGLIRIGDNLFQSSGASGPPLVSVPGQAGAGILEQGFLENSNVDSTTELVNLLLAQASFTANTRAIAVADQMLQATLDLIV